MFDTAPEGPPSPRKRPQQTRSRITVEAIIEASAQVLETDGYDALTTSRVAERAGVSIGTLYQYFPDKSAVVAALVENRLGGEVSTMRAALREAEGMPLLDAAVHVAGAFVGLFSGDPRRSAAVLHAALHVRWVPVMEGLLSQMIDAVADGLRKRPAESLPSQPETVAHVLVSAMFGVVMRSLLVRPELLHDGRAADEVEALVRGYLSVRGSA